MHDMYLLRLSISEVRTQQNNDIAVHNIYIYIYFFYKLMTQDKTVHNKQNKLS